MKKNLINLTIFATVAIIVTGALLVPVINDTVSEHRTTFSNFNEKGYLMGIEDISETHTITYSAGDSFFTYDSEELTPISGWNNFLVIADSFAIKILGSSLQFYIGDTQYSCAIGSDSNNVLNLTMANGTLSGTFVNNGFTNNINATYTTAMSKNSEGKYINVNSQGYIADNNSIFTYSKGSNYVSQFGNTYYTNLSGTVSTSYTETATDFDNVIVAKDLTTGNGSTTYTIYAFVVPLHIVGSDTVGTEAFAGLFTAIPVLVIIAILLGVVGVVLRRRE